MPNGILENEIKKDEPIVPATALENGAMYISGESRIAPVKGVYFGDSEIGTRKLVPRDASEIQKSIDNLNSLGGGVVFLKNGTYKMTTNITLFSNVYLEGENADATFIDFQDNTKSILIQGTNAYSAGTLSITHGDVTVTGVSTAWNTNLVAGMYILLGGIWYPISVVGGATSLTLSIPYAGATLVAGTTYTAAAIINDAKIINLTIKNGNDGVNVRYANEIVMRDINIQSCVTAITTNNSSQIQFDQVDLVANNAGLSMTDTHFTKAGELGVIDSLAGNGVTLNGVTNTSFQSSFVQNSSADGFNFTNCSKMNIFASVIGNGGQGVELVSGNSDLIFVGGAYENNASDGIKLTASSDNCQFIGNSIKGNGGYGVNIASSTCDNNNLTGNNFATNTSGNVNDLGTGTLIRGNVGVNDNSTGAQTVTQVIDSFTAAETLSAGDAVYLIAGATLPVSSIARDATSSFSQAGAGATSYTVAHTCTGSNLILIVNVWHGANEDSTVTYNGVSMTSAGARVFNGRCLQMFYLLNPATGTHNIVASFATSALGGLANASYTGLLGALQPDSYNTGTATGNISVSTTVVNGNCWLIGSYMNDSGGVSAGTGTSINIAQANIHGEVDALDSNAIVGTGSQSLAITTGGGAVGAMIVASFRPNAGNIAKSSASVAGTANPFIGFANTGASVSASVDVVVGGAKTGLSGLTAGSLYYLANTAGAISTSAGSVTRKVGIALSATKLLITNIW